MKKILNKDRFKYRAYNKKKMYYDPKDFEIIGNRFENPDLIKK